MARIILILLCSLPCLPLLSISRLALSLVL
jgi:hypothetical protein